MAKFFGVKLSENIIKRPDGFLICMGATIARTGYQKYKGSELDSEELATLGIKNVKDDDDVQVLRLYDDVFRPATLASFEGVVFTLTHPGKLVTVNTINENNQGHIQNVRMGPMLPDGNWPILCDIFVTGQDAIDAILIDGVRELSCGYNYKLKLFNGNICQYDIIGNHVALVESGRAGKYAAIKDSAPQEGIKFMADKFTSKFLRAVGLHALAQKATPEQFAAALDAADEAKEGKDNETKPEGEDMKHEAGCDGKAGCTCGKDKGKDSKPEAKDADFRARMHAALDRKIEAALTAQAMDDDKMLTRLLTGKDAEKEEAEDEKEEEESEGKDEEIEGEDSEEKEEGKDSEEEEVEGEDEAVESNASPEIPTEARFKTYVPSATDAAFQAGAKSILTMLKPVIAQSGNKKMIKAFDTAMKTVKGKAFGRDGYKAFATAASSRSKEAMDTQPKSVAQLQRETSEAADKAYAAMFRKG